jgi:predicted TIM-barrel fold metal-dependent hydrolase
MELPIVDAHQHFWDLGRHRYPWLQDPEPIPFRYGDYTALRRDWLPADYRRASARWRIVATVHVEAEADRAAPVRETRWLETLAAAEGLPSACVAWAALDEPEVDRVLAAHAAHEIVRGIRHKPAAAPSPAETRRGMPGSMDDPAWRRGYARLAARGLSFDLQTPWWHLDAAAELARDHPATTVILNHTGLPGDRSPEGLAGWRRGLETLATLPNAALKVSGLGRPGLPWTVAANGPVIRDAVAIFGWERCMLASNWPVDSLAGDFDAVVGGILAALADLPPDRLAAVAHDNARRLYRL